MTPPSSSQNVEIWCWDPFSRYCEYYSILVFQHHYPISCTANDTLFNQNTDISSMHTSQDTRFNKEVDKKTGYLTKSLLCMPIFNYDGDVIGIAQIMNKKDGSHEFGNADEEVRSP